MATLQTIEIGRTFMEALSERDFDRLQTSFQESIQFRALAPLGIRGAIGAEEAVGWLRRWFGSADEFEVLDSSVRQVADRLHIAYRVRIYQNEEWQVIEQQAYCTVSDDRIDVMNMVSSGFRPERQSQTSIQTNTPYDVSARVLSF